MRVQRRVERISAAQEEELTAEHPTRGTAPVRRRTRDGIEHGTRGFGSGGGGLLAAACGKTSTTSRVSGVYHLPGAADATSLEVRDDGTFALRRESCVSSGINSCGDWRAAAGGGRVVTKDGLYWPTPDSFPSAVVSKVTLEPRGRDLLVIGESEWAGGFTERWSLGRACAVCSDRVRADGTTYVVSGTRPCAEPLPACTRL